MTMTDANVWASASSARAPSRISTRARWRLRSGGALVGRSQPHGAPPPRSSRRNMASASRRTTCDELLQQPGLDAVCITTPSALHLEPALAAIRAGKHLMIEKPLDATVEGTDHILREAEKAGVRVGSIFQARFGDAARQVKAAIDAGRFGRMVLASCYVKWNRTTEYYTGWKGRLSEDGGGVDHQPGHPRRRPAAVVRRHAGGSVRVEHAARSRDRIRGHLRGGAEVRQRRVRHHRSAPPPRGRAGRAASRSAARTARR